MKNKKFISIQTKRYSEFFRRLFDEYKTNYSVFIDGKIVESAKFSKLIEDWCTNDLIKKTRDFKLSRDNIDLFGFHDGPDELWAIETELPFVERLAADKLIRFRTNPVRGNSTGLMNWWNLFMLSCILIVGILLQLIFWKTPDNTFPQAILSHSYLWIVYPVTGVFAAEHILNFFRRRK